MLRSIFLVIASASFAAMASDITDNTDNSSAASSTESATTAGATPYNLAYKYRFSACIKAQGQNARATWILEAAYKAGEISEAELKDPYFHNDVARFIRYLCPNHT